MMDLKALCTREDSTHGHHQMVNTEIKLIIFFAAKDGEALYSQQKQCPIVDVTGDGSKSDAVKGNIAQEPGTLDP